MGAEQTLIKLYKLGIVEIVNIFNLGFRFIGWLIIKFLATLSNGLENSVTKIYTLNGFFNSKEVTELINKYKPLLWVILAISIAIIGFKIIFNKKQNRDQLPSNLIFSICVIVLLPVFMVKMNTATTITVNDLNKEYKSSANQLIKNNLSDLYFLDKNNYNTNGKLNNIDNKNILNIDINQKLDTDNIESKNKKVFEKKVSVGDDGNLKLKKLEKGWFGIGDDEYYRFNLKSFPMVIISILTTCVTFVCVALKVARLEFELAFNKLFATIFAFADIDDGKKIREIIKHICSIFAVLIVMSVMIKMYVMFNSWLGSSANVTSLDEITKVIVLIGVSFGVIDGPNIVERILGIDAGLKDGWGAMMGIYGATQTASGLMKGTAGIAKKAGKKAGKSALAGASVMAGVAGAIDGFKDNKVSDGLDKNKKGKEGKKMPTLAAEMKKNGDLNNKNDKEDNVANSRQNDNNKSFKPLQEQMNENTNSSKQDSNGLIKPIKNNENSNKVNSANNSKSNEINPNRIKQSTSSKLGNESKMNKNNNGSIPRLNDEMKGNINDKDSSKPTLSNEMKQSNDEMNESMNGKEDYIPTLSEEMKQNNGDNDNVEFDSNLGMSEAAVSKLNDEMSGSVQGENNHVPTVSEGIKQSSVSNVGSSSGGVNNQVSRSVQGENNHMPTVSEGIKQGSVSNVGGSSGGINNQVSESVQRESNNTPTASERTTQNSINETKTKSNNKEVSGTMETRTLGEYIKDKAVSSKSFNQITRAYNLGKNSAKRWKVKREEKDEE